MKYSKVFIDSIGYEIAPVVVSSLELEHRLRDVYRALHLSEGQLEALTGIVERRWWEEGYRLSDGASPRPAGHSKRRGLAADQLDVLIYGGVCREHFEPATACRVGARLGVGPKTVDSRRQQRLPGRAHGHGRYRQPNRARTNSGRAWSCPARPLARSTRS